MASSKKPAIGYIGLGNAGHHLASVLSHAGYPLVVRDADSSRTSSFTSTHENATAATGYSSFHDVDVLITMLPNGRTVREVLLGKSPASRRGSGAALDGVTGSGVAEYLKDGAVIVDTSSASPYQTRETGTLLKEVNETLTLVDAPVTQEYAFALAKGEATFMVGCDDSAVLEKVKPVLETMGKHVFVMGGLGTGHAMKTLNNYTSAASILGLCDALVAGQQFGLEAEKMVDVMNVGTGVNFSTKESFRTDVSFLIVASSFSSKSTCRVPRTNVVARV